MIYKQIALTAIGLFLISCSSTQLNNTNQTPTASANPVSQTKPEKSTPTVTLTSPIN